MPEFCRSCRQPVRWAITVGGHRMPVDPDPVSDGNLRLELTGAGAPIVTVVPPGYRRDDEDYYQAHFRSCPDADDWRRR